MGAIAIRTLRGPDVPGVLTVWNRALRRNPMSAGRFVSAILADPDYRPGGDSGFFVATDGDEPIGFLRAIIRYWPNDRLGLEPADGWIPYLAVTPERQRRGVGTALLAAGLEFFARHGRQRVWVCGTPTSAPGSIMPGADDEAYPGARRLFARHGFVEDQPAFSMAREVVDFDAAAFRAWAWQTGLSVRVETLTPARVPALFEFLAASLPGAWNMAARAKVQSGALHELLVAIDGDVVVGYCQWTGEHFGPFGVAPAARQQRVGAKLFTEAVCRIRAADGRTVWFNWADDRARQFYERFGLRVTRRFVVLRRG